MTERTSSINDHSLNCSAVRAGIGLHKRELTTLGALEIKTRLSAIQAQEHQSTAQDTKVSASQGATDKVGFALSP
jgi:hypothetical protein